MKHFLATFKMAEFTYFHEDQSFGIRKAIPNDAFSNLAVNSVAADLENLINATKVRVDTIMLAQ
jgi:hypothetical protein